jgi:integrase
LRTASNWSRSKNPDRGLDSFSSETFAYVTGWRVPSEVLTLEWSAVDFDTGTVSLDFGVTKTEDARVFPFTRELPAVLEDQKAARDRLRAQGMLCALGYSSGSSHRAVRRAEDGSPRNASRH